jgi:hypothetical protein
MPIVELRENDLEQQCAVCGATRSVPLAELGVGVEIAPGTSDPSVIALPACVRCSAREFLVRTAAQEVSGGVPATDLPFDRHRQFVRDLYSALIRDKPPLSAVAPGTIATETHNRTL